MSIPGASLVVFVMYCQCICYRTCIFYVQRGRKNYCTTRRSADHCYLQTFQHGLKGTVRANFHHQPGNFTFGERPAYIWDDICFNVFHWELRFEKRSFKVLGCFKVHMQELFRISFGQGMIQKEISYNFYRFLPDFTIFAVTQHTSTWKWFLMRAKQLSRTKAFYKIQKILNNYINFLYITFLPGNL